MLDPRMQAKTHETMLIIYIYMQERTGTNTSTDSGGTLQLTYEYINRSSWWTRFIYSVVKSADGRRKAPRLTTRRPPLRSTRKMGIHTQREYHSECCEQFYAVECMPYSLLPRRQSSSPSAHRILWGCPTADRGIVRMHQSSPSTDENV